MNSQPPDIKDGTALKVIYTHHAILAFALSMQPSVLQMFIFKSTGMVSAVFAWAAIWPILVLLGLVPTYNFFVRRGRTRFALILGTILYAVQFCLLGFNPNPSIGYLALCSVVLGVQCSIYWFVRHLIVSVAAHHAKIGKQIATFQILQIGMTALGPLTLGLLAGEVAYSAAFFAAAIATLLSVVPLLVLNAPSHLEQHVITEIRPVWNEEKFRKIRPAFFWEGCTENLFSNSWAIAFFIFIGSVQTFGILTAASALIAGVLVFLTGKSFDRQKRKQLLFSLTIMRFAAMASYGTLAFLPVAQLALVLDVLYRFTDAAHGTVRSAYLFGLSNRVHPAHFHLVRELSLGYGRVLSGLILCLVFLFIDAKFLWAVMCCGAVAQLAWLYLARGDHLLHRE